MVRVMAMQLWMTEEESSTVVIVVVVCCCCRCHDGEDNSEDDCGSDDVCPITLIRI